MLNNTLNIKMLLHPHNLLNRVLFALLTIISKNQLSGSDICLLVVVIIHQFWCSYFLCHGR